MTSLSSILCAVSLAIPESPQVIPPEEEVVTNISLDITDFGEGLVWLFALDLKGR